MIGFRSSQSGDAAAPGAVTNISLPAGLQAADTVIVVFGSTRPSTANPNMITPPVGWTPIGSVVTGNDGVNEVTLEAFWAMGSIGNLSFTNSQTAGLAQGWVCAAFIGVDGLAPIDATAASNSNSGGHVTTNSVTVITAGAWHLIAGAELNVHELSSALPFVAATNGSPPSHQGAALLYNPTPLAAGATGTVLIGISVSDPGDVVAGIPFALRPITALMLSEGPPGSDGFTEIRTEVLAERCPGGSSLTVANLVIFVEIPPGGDEEVRTQVEFAEGVPGGDVALLNTPALGEGEPGGDAFYTLDLARFVEEVPGGDIETYYPLMEEPAPGGDSTTLIAEFYEISDDQDSLISLGSPRLFTEDGGGGDALVIALATLVLAEGGLPGEWLGSNLVAPLYEDAPGTDSILTVPSDGDCETRRRDLYCPRGDGTYRYPYPETLVPPPFREQSFAPLDIFRIDGPHDVNPEFGRHPFTIPPYNYPPVADVEAMSEALLDWWKPAELSQEENFIVSTGQSKDIFPDDQGAQLIYRLDQVDVVVETLATGKRHTAYVLLHRNPDLSFTLFKVSETVENFSFPGGFSVPVRYLFNPDNIPFFRLPFIECFDSDLDTEVPDPNYPFPRAMRLGGKHKFFTAQGPFLDLSSLGGIGGFGYLLTADIVDAFTITWPVHKYRYSVYHYSCCDGLPDCPPCTGPIVEIGTGHDATVCLESTYIPCALLPPGPTITGPLPNWAKLLHDDGCSCVVRVPCLSKEQQKTGGYQGPYTIAIPGEGVCFEDGHELCELRVGQFKVVANIICTDSRSPQGPQTTLLKQRTVGHLAVSSE